LFFFFTVSAYFATAEVYVKNFVAVAILSDFAAYGISFRTGYVSKNPYLRSSGIPLAYLANTNSVHYFYLYYVYAAPAYLN